MSAISGKPPVARVAVTVPPEGWFHGISRAMYGIYREALVELGVEVFDVPVEALLPPDHGGLADLIDDLKAFRPELAFGLPLGSYALIARLGAQRDGWRPNLFTDIFDIPTICFWDHAPFELADQLLTPHPATPGESRAGALASLRRALAHPRLLHWSRDSGQTRLMRHFGLLPETPPIFATSPALGGAVDTAAAPSPAADVAFIGHFLPGAEGPTASSPQGAGRPGDRGLAPTRRRFVGRSGGRHRRPAAGIAHRAGARPRPDFLLGLGAPNHHPRLPDRT